VLALLGQGEYPWGEIKLRKNTIEVGAVSEGAEETCAISWRASC
jgi:hypothetical protein